MILFIIRVKYFIQKKKNCTREKYNTSIKFIQAIKFQKKEKNHNVYAKEPMSNMFKSTRECIFGGERHKSGAKLHI